MTPSCLVCHEQRKLVGAVCAECRDELRPTVAITPEQVRTQGQQLSAAVLVDPFGRLHRLPPRTLVGRELDGDGLLILDSTISRRQASLEERATGWVLLNFSAVNCTLVEGKPVTAETALHDGERVQF